MVRASECGESDDLIDVAAMFPWWMGLLMAVVGYLGLHAWSVLLASATEDPAAPVNGFLHAFALTAQYGWPALCVTGAAMSAWRRHQRKRRGAAPRHRA
ncbi:MAG: hypothetical protein EOO24_13275 [Comamonadaceae bacterium]|nr:MAG: hypothetical protein EOO24_13275 [Comamonadaceae bacterium]